MPQVASCCETAAGLGLAAPGCLPGLREGAAPASSRRAPAVEDEGFIPEPLERSGVCLLFLFTWAIAYVWNILPLLPFTWPTPIHLLCLSLNVTSLETILVSQLLLLSASFVSPTVHLLQVIILLFVCVCVCM